MQNRNKNINSTTQDANYAFSQTYAKNTKPEDDSYPAWKLAEQAKGAYSRQERKYAKNAYNFILKNVPKHRIVYQEVTSLQEPHAAWFVAVLDPVTSDIDTKYAYSVTGVKFAKGHLQSRIGIGFTKYALTRLYRGVFGQVDQRRAEEFFVIAAGKLMNRWATLQAKPSTFTLAIEGVDCLLVGDSQRNRVAVTGIVSPDLYTPAQREYLAQQTSLKDTFFIQHGMVTGSVLDFDLGTAARN